MRKIIFVFAFIAVTMTANAQFSIGASVGLPTGDAGDVTSVSFSVDAAYMFEVSETIDVGFTGSYLYYSGDDPFPNWSFLPLAGAARFDVGSNFTLGADLGYAIGLNPDGNDGGFYYKPLVGYAFNEKTTLNLSYSSVSLDGATVSNIGLGVMFGI